MASGDAMWLPKFVIPAACLVLAGVSGCTDTGSVGTTPTSGAPEQSRGNTTPTVEANSEEHSLFVEPHFQCGPAEPERGFPQGFLSWTADGTHLVFNHLNQVWRVDQEGTRLRNVLDANPEPASSRRQYFFVYWFAADVSPDDSQIAYTSCQFPTEYEQAGVSEDNAAALLARVGADWYDRGKYQYEIAVSGIDGDNQERLTRNLRLDHYPVWSPSGERIAFMSSLEDPEGRHIVSQFSMQRHRVGLFIMSSDGSDVRQVAPQLKSIALSSPKWSPDGQRLAVIVNEGERLLEDVQALYIVKYDGSEVRRIGEAAAVPAAWSPDGGRLSFVGPDGQSLYTTQPDGTGTEEIWRGEDDVRAPVSQVLWSPDGSAILVVVADRAQAVELDGHALRPLLDWQPSQRHATRAAWSPDGSRIAFYNPSEGVLTIARDGSDPRHIVEAYGLGLPHLPDR